MADLPGACQMARSLLSKKGWNIPYQKPGVAWLQVSHDLSFWSHVEFLNVSGLIRVLNKQLATKSTVNIQTVRKKWRGLSLELEDLEKILAEGKFRGRTEIEWRRFLALICVNVAHGKAPDLAMKIVSEAFSDQSKGEGCSMKMEDFIDMFKHVAAIKGMKEDKVKEIVDYLASAGAKQDGILSYENFKTDLCPPLS